ncbi:MFS transporter [Sphingomonas histidinilytica]|uniref:Sugar phosphate permease n=1 Tax=Rhizorhabdus histidinilytica TaxID=439228 RepID=A0A1T5FNA8_9SPHN|nr:MFS transporter [Rhizorhabdus histidinilytica]MBO9377148.1 MFS transporter [Rhizorhabdus histidinilytica]SKB97661.1 Sugar phosphate permease [Rhizorhabdus histidinilytica]
MRRIFPGWLLVGAVMVALMLCGTTIVVSTFGIFTAHWMRSFGWSQGAMAGSLSIFLLSTTLAVPVAGVAVDRFGSRRTAIFGVTAFAALLAAVAPSVGSLPSLFLFYALLGLLGAFTNPIVYIRALSAWFDRRRGIALGIAVAGQGLGAAVLPPLVQYVSESAGWRSAFHLLSAGLVLIVLPLVLLFVRDDPAALGVRPDGGVRARPADGDAAGLTLAEARRTGAFWIILIVFALFGLVNYALSGHFVYLMLQRGVGTLPQIAMLLSIAGASMIGGRVLFGWLFDRYPLPLVGAAGVLCGGVALALLLGIAAIGPAAFAMSVLMGVAMGAETDLLSLLVSRYFGQRAISRIYSWQNVSFLAGAAGGPPLFALLLERFSDPTVPILVLIALCALSVLLLLLLKAPAHAAAACP